MIETSPPVAVLAVLSSPTDRRSLDHIIGHSHWTLSFAKHLSEVRTVLRDRASGVVITDSTFPDGLSWKDVLGAIRGMRHPPQLIVADRVGDDRLWAEVLNHGCYDLLLKPFDPKEVLSVVSAAWRSWRSGLEWPPCRPAVRVSEWMDHDWRVRLPVGD